MMTRMLALSAAIGALTILAHPAAAQDRVRTQCQVEVDRTSIGDYDPRPKTVGFMKRVDGPVGVIRRIGDNEYTTPPKPAVEGMDLFAQDAIVTGAGAETGFEVIFTDNTVVSGNGDTCVEISKYIDDPAKKSSEFRLRLGKGLVSINAGDIAKIRGDTMSVKVRDDTNLAVTGTVLVVRAQ